MAQLLFLLGQRYFRNACRARVPVDFGVRPGPELAATPTTILGEVLANAAPGLLI